MKIAAHSMMGARRRHLRTGFPRLTFIDILGLVFAALLVSFQLAPVALEQQVLLVVMTASGLVAWLYMAQFKSLVTVLTRVNYRMLVVPAFAALLTLVAYGMLSGGVYPLAAIATFAGFWTLWMVGARAFYQRHRSVLRTLVIGNPGFNRELAKLPQLATQRLDTPPDGFDDFDIVVLDPVKLYDRDWLQWLSHADMAGLKIIAAPLVFETLEKRIPLEMLHGRWAYAIFNGQSGYAFWKRVLDVTIVTLAAPFLLLLAGVVALVVLFDSGRPVLFWQRRVGQDGAPFMMVKFRTMRPDADVQGEAFAAERDPRVTRIGAFLRKFRLDEIPQFYNVLKGEMSIIGPRPEQEGFAQRFVDEIPLYKLRYNVKPGITGWAQVMNGYAAGTEETREKLRYDFYYIKYFSFELDMQVVLRTIRIILTGFGAR